MVNKNFLIGVALAVSGALGILFYVITCFFNGSEVTLYIGHFFSFIVVLIAGYMLGYNTIRRGIKEFLILISIVAFGTMGIACYVVTYFFNGSEIIFYSGHGFMALVLFTACYMLGYNTFEY